jgi:FkbM family methyltransferase
MLLNSLKRAAKRRLLNAISPAELLYWKTRLNGRIEPELAVFSDFVRRGDVAIDVGANVGLYSLAFLRRGANVVAIEPLARNVLDLNRLSARFGRLTVCQAAASDTAGRAELRVPVGDTDLDGYATLRALSTTHNVESVRTIRLDDLELDNVAAIKIDVEGCETAVINGARGLIKKHQPFLMIEIEQRYLSQPIFDVIRIVEGLGYLAFYLEAGILRPAAQFAVSTHQSPGGRVYINNFIFKPRGGVGVVAV